MTPDKNFRMKSEYKSMITLMGGTPEQRSHLKKMLIQAQLHEEAARKAALKAKVRDQE